MQNLPATAGPDMNTPYDEPQQSGPGDYDPYERRTRDGNNKAHRPKYKRTRERKLKKQAQRRSRK